MTRTTVRPLAEVERAAILAAVQACDGDRALAAKLLGIGQTTIYRKLVEWGSILPPKAARVAPFGKPEALVTVKTPRFLRVAATRSEIAQSNAQCPSCRAKLIVPDISGVL